jgi:hypothetical protein
VAPSRRVVDPLLQCALRMWERLGRASEVHALAYVVPPFKTQLTLLTRLADLERNPVTHLEVTDARTDGRDDARGLVTQRQGFPDEDVAITVVTEVVQVGAAEAGGLDGDLDLVCCGIIQSSVLLRLVSTRDPFKDQWRRVGY